MRDPHFIAVHRGGLLDLENQRALMRWAVSCARHLIGPQGYGSDLFLEAALAVGDRYAEGIAKTKDAIEASRAVHKRAKVEEEAVTKLCFRIVGQAVATAHMADHCLGPVWYGKRLLVSVAGDWKAEVAWQRDELAKLCSQWYPFVVQGMERVLSYTFLSTFS